MQWPSGRVLDLRPRGCEPQQRHCFVSMSMAHESLRGTGTTQEDPSPYN